MARIGDLDIAMTIHHFKVVFTKFFDCLYFEHWTGSMSNWVKYKNGRPMADIKSHINNKKYSRTKKNPSKEYTHKGNFLGESHK